MEPVTVEQSQQQSIEQSNSQVETESHQNITTTSISNFQIPTALRSKFNSIYLKAKKYNYRIKKIQTKISRENINNIDYLLKEIYTQIQTSSTESYSNKWKKIKLAMYAAGRCRCR